MNAWREIAKEHFENFRVFVKRQEERIISWTVIVGLSCFLLASALDPSVWPKMSSLFVNLGSASIVSGVIYFVMSLSRKGLENTIKESVNNIGDKLDNLTNELTATTILKDANECGIEKIFKSRRDRPTEILDQLISEFEKMPENETITIMAISLRDLIIGDAKKKIFPVLNRIIIEKNVKVRLLLLDPTSESAVDRARVEEPGVFKKGGYSCSSLFRDSMAVAEFLTYPGQNIVPAKIQRKVFSNIEVRYYPYDPTTFVISTYDHRNKGDATLFIKI